MITLARAPSLPWSPCRPIRTATYLESFRRSENTFVHMESFLPTGVIVSKDSSAFLFFPMYLIFPCHLYISMFTRFGFFLPYDIHSLGMTDYSFGE